MCKVSTRQSLIKRYLLTLPPNRQVWHKSFFKVGPGAGSELTRARRLQKCHGPRRHSPKEGRLRRQAINLAPPMRVKDWEDSPLRLEEINHPTRMPDSQLKSLCTKQGLIKLSSYSQWDTYMGSLSLTLMQIRKINLPVSLHLPGTCGSCTPSRSYTSSDCFIFGIALLSLSLSWISFSGRSRSVPHWL